jgi:hypothetical protein
LIAREVTAFDFSSEEPTARLLIWVEPTLLRGSVIAAYPVPPSATKSAITETTLANVSLERT